MSELVKNVILVGNEDEIQEEEGKFFLKQIAWNDYGWNTNYSLYYRSKNNNLGRIKVVFIDEYGEVYDDPNNEIDGRRVYMIADGPEVYKKLNNVVKEENLIGEFLSNMGDLTYDPNLYNQLLNVEEGEEVLVNSFFRYPRTRVMFAFYKEFREYSKEEKNMNDDWVDLTFGVLLDVLSKGNYLGKLAALAENVDKVFENISNNLKSEWDTGDTELKNIVINIACTFVKEYFKDNNKYLDNDVFGDSTSLLTEALRYSENQNNMPIDDNEIEFINTIEKIKPFSENNELIRLFSNLKHLDTSVNRIRKILTLTSDEFTKNSKRKLGQYTSAKSLKYLINRDHLDKELGNKPGMRTLRLTNTNQLNDPKEGKIFWDILGKRVTDGNNKSQIDDYDSSAIFLSSTTASIDILPMWKQYGDDGKGLFLKYSTEYIKDLCDSDVIQVRRVCYLRQREDNENLEVKLAAFPGEDVKEKERKISEELRKLKENPDGLDASIKDIVYAFKRMEYSYENEFRIFINLENMNDRADRVFFDDKPGFAVPFVYTTIKNKDIKENINTLVNNEGDDFLVNYDEVIVGPVAVDIDYIAPYIKECDENIKVKKSKILYR